MARDVLLAAFLDCEAFLQNQLCSVSLGADTTTDACSSESAKSKTKLAYLILFGDGAGQDFPGARE